MISRKSKSPPCLRKTRGDKGGATRVTTVSKQYRGQRLSHVESDL